MNLQMRIDLATKLGEYILDDSVEWQETKTKAGLMNPWFTPDFVELASQNVAKHFLQKQKLTAWKSAYNIDPVEPKNSGTCNGWQYPISWLS